MYGRRLAAGFTNRCLLYYVVTRVYHKIRFDRKDSALSAFFSTKEGGGEKTRYYACVSFGREISLRPTTRVAS